MRHPFDLNMNELEAINDRRFTQLSDSESAAVSGGFPPIPDLPNSLEDPTVTTYAMGEEGGSWFYNDGIYYGEKKLV